jgi:hypothetical protein
VVGLGIADQIFEEAQFGVPVGEIGWKEFRSVVGRFRASSIHLSSCRFLSFVAPRPVKPLTSPGRHQFLDRCFVESGEHALSGREESGRTLFQHSAVVSRTTT